MEKTPQPIFLEKKDKMKHFFLLAFSLIALTSEGLCQSKAKVGVSLGFSSASQKFTEKIANGGMQKTQALGCAEFKILLVNSIKKIHLKTQLGYTQKGFLEKVDFAQLSNPNIIRTYSFQNRLDYLSLEILSGVSIPKTHNKIRIESGFQYCRLFNHHLEVEALDILYFNGGFIDPKLNTLEYLIGLDLLVNKKVSFNVSLVNGLTNSFKNEFIKSKNNAILMSMTSFF